MYNYIIVVWLLGCSNPLNFSLIMAPLKWRGTLALSLPPSATMAGGEAAKNSRIFPTSPMLFQKIDKHEYLQHGRCINYKVCILPFQIVI